MKKHINFPIVILSAFLIRILITGSSLSDSLILASFSALYAFYHFLEQKREPIVNKLILDRINNLEIDHKSIKERVSSATFGSSIKR